MRDQITRRTALKLMGAVAGSVVLGGVTTLSGCKPNSLQDVSTNNTPNEENKSDDASAGQNKVKRLVCMLSVC